MMAGRSVAAARRKLSVAVDRRLGVDPVGQRVGALRGRAGADGLEPALEVRKLVQVLALALVRHDPGIGRHVGDRVVAGDELALRQLAVEHAIQAVGFLDVALDGVGDALGRIGREVVVLAGHGAQSAHLPEQPLQHVGAPAQVGGDELAGLLGQVQQDGAGLEQRDRRAAIGRRLIDDGRDAVVGRDGQEFRLELLALADVDGVYAVRQAGLFEKERDLVAVGSRPVVEIDHGAS
ncbi:Uncharacterised protein [Bordetella pertussis]|nr:Uncharacterised protein [Bordetella pertussis]